MYKSIYLQGTSPVFDTLLPPRESTSDRPDAYQKQKKTKQKAFRTLIAEEFQHPSCKSSSEEPETS